LSNYSSVDLSLTDSLTTATSFNAGTADITVTGAGTLTLAGTTTAGSINASALSTVVTAELQGGATLSSLTTGSNADVITTTTAASTGGYTLSTGLGADSLTFGAAGQAQGDLTWDGGGGVDTINFGTSADIDAETYDLTSVEVITFATRLTADASFLDGSSYLITSAGTGALTIAAMDQATVDLSNISFTNDTNTTSINGAAIGAFSNLNITGTALVDAVVGGAGDDTVNLAAGANTYTTGGGVDTYTGGVGIDTITMSTVAGTLNFTGGGTATDVINAGAGVANTVNILDATAITFTGNTGADTYNGGSLVDVIVNSTAAGGAEADVITTGTGADTITVYGDVASGALATIDDTTTKITDFTVGTDTLILSATAANYTGITTAHGGIAVDAAGDTEVTDLAQSVAGAAVSATTDFIKLTTDVATAGLTAQQAFNLAIGTSTLTGMTADTDIFYSLYDTTNSQMVIGAVDNTTTTNTVLETADVVTLIATLDMTSAEYALFSNADLQIIA